MGGEGQGHVNTFELLPPRARPLCETSARVRGSNGYEQAESKQSRKGKERI